MKLVLKKNHLGGQILYISLDPSKKRRQNAKNKNQVQIWNTGRTRVKLKINYFAPLFIMTPFL